MDALQSRNMRAVGTEYFRKEVETPYLTMPQKNKREIQAPECTSHCPTSDPSPIGPQKNIIKLLGSPPLALIEHESHHYCLLSFLKSTLTMKETY